MKKALPSPFLLVMYRVLIGVTLLLGLSLLGGTVYALILRNLSAEPAGKGLSPNQTRKQANDALSPQKTLPTEFIEGQTFTGIGQLRVTTTPPQPVTVIFSITFPYFPEDKAFSEELASKAMDFRHIAGEYFSSLSAEELRVLDEGDIKAELLRRYNTILRLGHIELLYFNDFMIID
jgi:flagellar basal body-associated protein FliL